MTVSQAIVEFLAHQYTVDGDYRERTVAGMFGIFGHGNVAGISQALLQANTEDPTKMPFHHARNEQGMANEAIAYARMTRRRSVFACAASVGPGAANMLTSAAVATTNRLPVLLLPSDTFANRAPDPVLQQLELPHDATVTVNDAFKPLSRFFDRVTRPEQLYSALLGAMRVLTDPVETGAVTIALPEDVQAEVIDVPEEFLADREWHIRRPRPDAGVIEAAARVIRSAKRPMIIAGGGVIYSDAHAILQRLVEGTGIPVGMSQAGVGSLNWDHPQNLGAVGATGTSAANKAAAEADVIIGIGTRYSDFTTSSRTAFQNPDVRFININVGSFDAFKHGSAIPVVADARESLTELLPALAGYHVPADFGAKYSSDKREWDAAVDESFVDQKRDLPSQAEIIGAVQAASDPRDVLICAAGSLPGDLHKLWRVRDPLGYHVEYAFSTMGYEIAAGLGVARADKTRDGIVMVGDGSYMMLHSELVTAVAERLKFITVLIQNHGYASIGHLSEDVGSQRFGTKYRFKNHETNSHEGDEKLSIDLAANARSYGVRVIEVAPGPNALADLSAAVKAAKAHEGGPVLIHINSDPLIYAPDGLGWWDVPVSAVSTVASTKQAYQDYAKALQKQKKLLGNGSIDRGTL
jgi:3D-(3,5/4)-trihydroxycyclohexane-1,2-dione acylhydrolase (decyclizing)